MKWPLIVLFAGSLVAQDAQRFFYSKSFPGSVPAYVQVTLEKNGEAVYKEAPDDDLPLTFKLTEAETAEVFRLVEKLDYFRHPIESGLKVAFLGTKTFRLENGTENAKCSSTTRRTPTPGCFGIGANAWRNRPSTASLWSAPPSTTNWAWCR